MQRIPQRVGGRTPVAAVHPSNIHAFPDTIRFWSSEPLPPRNIKWLDKRCALKVEDKPAKFGFRYRQWLQLQQPMTDEVLPFLATLDHHNIPNYAELSLDWVFNQPADCDDANRRTDQYIIKKWHGKQRVTYDKTTRYTALRGAPNQIVTYNDKPCRITGEEHVVHVEWRATGAMALRRIGINSIADLATFNHRKFWEERLVMRAVDARILGRIVRTHSKERRHASDLRAGQMLLAGLGSTQNVVDHFHGQFDISRCLVDLNVSHLLPSHYYDSWSQTPLAKHPSFSQILLNLKPNFNFNPPIFHDFGILEDPNAFLPNQDPDLYALTTPTSPRSGCYPDFIG